MRKRIDLTGLVKLDRDYPTDTSCVRKLADFQVLPEFPEILLLDVSRFVRFRNQHFDVFHDFLVRQSDAVKLVKDLPKLRHIFGSVEQSVPCFQHLIGNVPGMHAAPGALRCSQCKVQCIIADYTDRGDCTLNAAAPVM